MSHAEAAATRQQIGAPPLPNEHGAWIGLAASALVGLIHGGGPDLYVLPAMGAALCFFVAKASAEHFAIGLRPERATFWLTTLVFAGGALLALLGNRLPTAGAPIALVAALGALLAHGIARNAKSHRALVYEAFGFFGMGGAAALVLVAKGGSAERAIALWILLGAHFAATVPFVRMRVRPADKRKVLAGWSVGLEVAAILAALGLASAGFAPGAVVACFVPGLAKVIWYVARGEGRTKAKRVGLEETGWTTLFVSALLVALALG